MKETIPKKSMKSKTSFFFSFLKKINKKRPIKEKKRKREEIQIANIRNKRGDITADETEITNLQRLLELCQ